MFARLRSLHEVLKAWILKLGLCVLVFLSLTALAQAQGLACKNYMSAPPSAGNYEERCKACVTEIKRYYPAAWEILNSFKKDPGIYNRPMNPEKPSDTAVKIGLAAESGGACDEFLKSYKPDLPPSAQLVKKDDILACMAEMKYKRPAAWKKLTEKSYVDFDNPPIAEDIYRALQDNPTIPRGPQSEAAPASRSQESPSKASERVPAPSDDSILSAAGQWFISPGSYLLSYIWITPESWFGLIAAILLSWWLYVTAIRLAWVIPGRIFGFYNPANFRFFTWLWIPWRPFYRHLWLRFSWWKEEVFSIGKVSTARTAGIFETLAYVYKPGDIYLGRFRPYAIPAFQPVGIDGGTGRHLCMIAGTGGGKTAHLITMLGLHDGTAFIIDPKGQIARVMAGRMADGGNGVIGKGMKVCILDPSGTVTEHPSLLAKWNPFDELRRAGERAAARGLNRENAIVDFALKMVDGLIIRYAKENPFWPGAARDFLHGLILYVYKTESPERQTLGRLYELLTVGLPEKVPDTSKYTGFDVLLYEMSKNTAFGGVIAQSAAGIQDASDGTSGNLLITMREQLQWLKLPALRKVSEFSSFYLEELHGGKLILFVCAKLTDMKKTFPGWFRLLSVLALAVFEDINRPLKHPCLFALDEFPSLGKIEALETAAPYMRSFGVRLLVVAQNIRQLSDNYENWETFTGNSECTWWMATQHDDNLTHLEKKLGKATVKERLGPPWWWPFSRHRAQYGRREREVMTAEEIKRFLARNNVIVTRGQRAFLLKPEPYFKALPVCFYDRDTNYREKRPRSFTRKIFAWFIAPRNTGPVILPREDLEPIIEQPETPAPYPMAPAASGPVTIRASVDDDERMIEELGPVAAPAALQVTVRPGVWSSADPDFVNLFTKCFGEQGSYPNTSRRRAVYNGFSAYLTQGGDFQSLHMNFEEWLCLPDSNLTKNQADRIGEFFDKAVEWSQKRKA